MKQSYVSPELSVDDQPLKAALRTSYAHFPSVTATVTKTTGFNAYTSSTDPNIPHREIQQCNNMTTGVSHRTLVDHGYIRFASENASNCLDLRVLNAAQRHGYIASVNTRNITGQSFLFSLVNTNNDRQEQLVQLPMSAPGDPITANQSYFLMPPREAFGQGYAFFFDNISIGTEQTVNDLGEFRLQPFPYDYIRSIRFERPQSDPPAPVWIYAQNYDTGWNAYYAPRFKSPISNMIIRAFPFIFGTKLTHHVEYNNWANAWVLPTDIHSAETLETTQFMPIFWPQYLEYAGFILGGCVLWLTLRLNKPII
jgi:hypothetical protein